MSPEKLSELFTPEVLIGLFPPDRTNAFFDALFGDAEEGAYDITLAYGGYQAEKKQLLFELRLNQRPGKCLACNLTHGLPEVFARHPLLDLKGVVQGIERVLAGRDRCTGWKLGSTRSISSALHIVPLIIDLSDHPG